MWSLCQTSPSLTNRMWSLCTLSLTVSLLKRQRQAGKARFKPMLDYQRPIRRRKEKKTSADLPLHSSILQYANKQNITTAATKSTAIQNAFQIAHLTRAQELCESRGGRPGLPVPNKPTVSVDIKQHFNQHTRFSASSRRTSLRVQRRQQLTDWTPQQFLREG